MAPSSTNTPLVAFVLDFETGGLKCQTSACTQIAVHAIRLDTFKKTASFVRYIAPYCRQEIKAISKPKRKVLKSKYEIEDEQKPQSMDYEDRALEYSAITMEMLETKGEPLKQVAADCLAFMQENAGKCRANSKPFIIGQNIGFDEGFLCQMFEYAGLMPELQKTLRGATDFYGHWHPLTLDTIVLGQLALCNQPDVTSYKLEIMCERLGIELDDAHDADADVAATAAVANLLSQRMRNNSEGAATTIEKKDKTRKHFKI